MFKLIYSCLLITTVSFLSSGCTSIQVNPISSEEFKNIREICIVNNLEVKIVDFVPVLEKRLQQHKIATRKINEVDVTQSCEYALRYSARRSWDITTYLSWAELNLFKQNQQIASAEYSLVAKGGLSLMKWQSVETKMNPGIDRLLGLAN